MHLDNRLVAERFPRSSRYNPEWLIASASGGANSLWLTEWLAEAIDLRAGMRVLDLGFGYVRIVGRRHRQTKLQDFIVSIPGRYTKKSLLRSEE
jgi:hypothetical protein